MTIHPPRRGGVTLAIAVACYVAAAELALLLVSLSVLARVSIGVGALVLVAMALGVGVPFLTRRRQRMSEDHKNPERPRRIAFRVKGMKNVEMTDNRTQGDFDTHYDVEGENVRLKGNRAEDAEGRPLDEEG